MIRLSFLVAWSLVAPNALAQLYLLAGSTTGNYPESFASALLRVGTNGSVTEVAELVPQAVGNTFIGVSYDWRRAVLMTGDSRVLVLDFDRGSVVKKCEIPAPYGVEIHAWLANPPTTGPTFEWQSAGPPEGAVRGMVLDPAVGCDKSFLSLQPDDFRYIVAHGSAGVGDVVEDDGTFAAGLIAGENTGQVYVFMGKAIPMEYRVPRAMFEGTEFTHQGLVINDSSVFVLRRFQKGITNLVFRKSDRSWHILPEVLGSSLVVRGFGRYIAAQGIVGEEQDSAAAKNSFRTPGLDRWRTRSTRMGPALSARVGRARYPGKLYVYDTETEKMFSIVTNQGDSEVVLIDGRNVYYRAADQLYVAVIGERGIGPARLLATDDLIRDAHWAFIKR